MGSASSGANLLFSPPLLYDLLWEDCESLMKDVRGRAIAGQMIRSGGSIGANVEEGFGRRNYRRSRKSVDHQKQLSRRKH